MSQTACFLALSILKQILIAKTFVQIKSLILYTRDKLVSPKGFTWNAPA